MATIIAALIAGALSFVNLTLTKERKTSGFAGLDRRQLRLNKRTHRTLGLIDRAIAEQTLAKYHIQSLVYEVFQPPSSRESDSAFNSVEKCSRQKCSLTIPGDCCRSYGERFSLPRGLTESGLISARHSRRYQLEVLISALADDGPAELVGGECKRGQTAASLDVSG